MYINLLVYKYRALKYWNLILILFIQTEIKIPYLCFLEIKIMSKKGRVLVAMVEG